MSLITFFWRDFKSAHAFNSFYVLCALLGIIGLLLVESFRLGIEDKFSQNAKNFIAADLSVSSRTAFTDAQRTQVESYLAAQKFRYAKWTETYSLVTRHSETTQNTAAPLSDTRAKLADLNFVSAEFPFYGSVTLEGNHRKGPGQWATLHSLNPLNPSPKAWLSRDLAWELNAKVGDQIKIGEALFTLDALVIEDQFSSFRGFNLAPKIFLSDQFISQTQLIKFGSTATFSYAIALPSGIDTKKIQQDLRNIFPDKSVKIVTPEASNQQISRSLKLLSDYLSLITLMAYLLSLIGLYYFTQHFLAKKMKTFAIYKALGLKASVLFKINFFHLILLTMIAVVIAASLVMLSLPVLEQFFSQLLGETLYFRLSPRSLISILLLSLGGSLLALSPLFWGALQVPVASVFQDLPAELKRIQFYYFLPLLIYIVLLTIVLANSIKVGAYFIGALTLILLLAFVIYKCTTQLLDRYAHRLAFVNRHAAKMLSRYFVSSFTIFICLLLGMTLCTFIFQLDHSVRAEFTQSSNDKRPDLFAFDIQDSQAAAFTQLTQQQGWNRTLFSPMIRGRLLTINGQPVQKKAEEAENTFTTREEENAERMRNRGVNLSYREQLSWSEKLVEGTFHATPCDAQQGPCAISLEQSYARRLGAKIGDTLLFDISDVEVQGIVTSLRRVKWSSFEPNFFILFQPGVLEEAPATYLASIKVRSAEEKTQVFQLIAQQFPNVSLLEVSEAIKKMTTIFDLMAIAIKVIAMLSLAVALIVLIAVSFNHLELRKREMTLFYMLGLSSNLIKKIYAREFIFSISLCLLLSLIFGSALTLTMMHFIFGSDALLRPALVMPLMTTLSVILVVIVNARITRLIKHKNLF